MMNLYSFGFYVRCSRCGRAVKSVRAGAWEDAMYGRGVCRQCYVERGREHLRDLLHVRGIGTIRARELAVYGINSLGDLAALDDDGVGALASSIGVSIGRVLDWRDQARDLIDQRTEERELMRGEWTAAVEG